jgi:hypothetical protein
MPDNITTPPGDGASSTPPVTPAAASPPVTTTPDTDAIAKQLVEAQRAIGSLTNERDTLKTAHERAIADLSAAQNKLNEFGGQVAKLTNDSVSMSQALAEAQRLVNERDTKIGALQTQADFLATITSNPTKYSGVVGKLAGVLPNLKPDITKEEIAAMLDAFAADTMNQQQAITDQALNSILRGGTVPGVGGSVVPTNNAGVQGQPTTVDAAWANLQRFDPVRQPDEYNLAMQAVLTLMESQQKTPN